MLNKKIVVTVKADNDLDGIFEYSLKNWGLKKVDEYTSAIENSFEELRKGNIVSFKKLRLLNLDKYNYITKYINIKSL